MMMRNNASFFSKKFKKFAVELFKVIATPYCIYFEKEVLHLP
jgi:hypothetical protein